MSKEISEIYKIYDTILSNREIIKEQEKSKITNIFGDAEVIVDNSDSGVAPPSGWTKGIKYILKNGGDIYSPLKSKVIAIGKLSNTGNNYVYLETSDKNQVYIGNLSSISVVKNQSIDIGNKLGSVDKGSYVYICSKSTPVQNIVSNKGEFSSNYSGRYNPSGSITGDYLASKIGPQLTDIKEQRGGDEEDTDITILKPVPYKDGIRSNFLQRRKGGYIHPGVDIGATQGTKVIAPMDGLIEVADINFNAPCGGTIDIDHGNGYWTRFCHMSRIDVSVGQFVNRGQLVGLSGGADGSPGEGRSDGPHLHWTLYKDGNKVDALKHVNNVVDPYSGPAPTAPTTSTDDDENSPENNSENNPELIKKAEKVIEEVKKKLDLSDMTPEEKKKILDKLQIGAVVAAISGGTIALYALISSAFSSVKKVTTDTTTSTRYNPSGSKLGEYIGDVVKFVIPI
jgi:murein DD-endopeptidase MepM/ murein hydrolase activator NlpD